MKSFFFYLAVVKIVFHPKSSYIFLERSLFCCALMVALFKYIRHNDEFHKQQCFQEEEIKWRL